MVTATTNRVAAGLHLEVRLALLAARAITGLADLAENAAWNRDIEEDIQAGIEFCQAIRSLGDRRNPIRRHVPRPATQAGGSETGRPMEEVAAVEAFLKSLLDRRAAAERANLLAAIDFFVRASGSRQPAYRK